VIRLPPLVLLDGECPNEPEAIRLIGEDPRHVTMQRWLLRRSSGQHRVY
jgi:hypothetical protein